MSSCSSYAVDINSIAELNKLDNPDNIGSGQNLNIPVIETLQITHTFTSPIALQEKAPLIDVQSNLTTTKIVDFSMGCQRPPELYKRELIDGQTINSRTLWMLKLADQIYDGTGNPFYITQGSYTNVLSNSFETHAGGGVIDISIRTRDDYNKILDVEEANDLVLALRQAGFAAWLRLPNDLNPPVSLHIHAVAIGDRELSDAAIQQLVGAEGYFRGFNGVPPQFGGPKLDRHGGPIMCDWMIDMGFNDLR